MRGSTSLGPRSDRAGEAVRGAAAELDAAAPFGRVCRPEDVAAVVAFLTGPDAGYVAGHRLVVDGGGPATGLLPPGAPGPGSG